MSLTVNGIDYPVSLTPGRTLLSVLRTEVGLTGAKEGCDDSECGACMVLLDGKPVNSCSYLALQAEGRAITTVEGIATNGSLTLLQQALLEEGGVQCGYCTPGIVIAAHALLAQEPDPDEEQIREALAGNLCRCTGYQKIIRAVKCAADAQRTANRLGERSVSADSPSSHSESQYRSGGVRTLGA